MTTDAYRTPDSRFSRLPGYDFDPHYTTVAGLRMHHVEAGPADGEPVLLLHGEPTWSFLYRKMIPVIADAGHRVLAPDLPGFGRSDKPVRRSDYSYSGHVAWVAEWIHPGRHHRRLHRRHPTRRSRLAVSATHGQATTFRYRGAGARTGGRGADAAGQCDARYREGPPPRHRLPRIAAR